MLLCQSNNFVMLFVALETVAICFYTLVAYNRNSSKSLEKQFKRTISRLHELTSKIYKKYKGRKKIIGICLGYQQILFNEKGKIVQQKNIFHGYQSKVKVTNESKLFKKNKIFKVGRYHSLKLYEPYKSNNIKITMRCAKSNIPMAIENKENNVYGFQFHPESFLTENGNFIIKKILSS